MAAALLGAATPAAAQSTAPSAATAAPRTGASSAPETSAAGGRVDATSPAPLSVWYRSSEACPEGAVFVARLAELGRPATLARVGDRVDFVVTVAAAASASSGRLERQTARGTVAIRELQAPRCDEVTEALALSLDIALDPESVPARSLDAPASPRADATSIDANASAAGASIDGLRNQEADSEARADTLGARRAETSGQSGRGALQLGAQGSVAKGIAPSWAPGAALFAELRPESDWALAARASLALAAASDAVAAFDVEVLSLAGRVEGCAFELRAGGLSLQPCAGAELGLLRAESDGGAGRTDLGTWGAGVGLVRASAELAARFALEAQVGAALPVVRYAVGSSLGGDLFRTEAVVWALALGARWAP